MKKKLCNGAKLLRKFGVVGIFVVVVAIALKVGHVGKNAKNIRMWGATAFVINERNTNPPLSPPVLMMMKKKTVKNILIKNNVFSLVFFAIFYLFLFVFHFS